MQTILSLLGSLDAIDFNLYVAEQAIPVGEMTVEWDHLFLADRIDFTAIRPRVKLPLDLVQYTQIL